MNSSIFSAIYLIESLESSENIFDAIYVTIYGFNDSRDAVISLVNFSVSIRSVSVIAVKNDKICCICSRFPCIAMDRCRKHGSIGTFL